VVRQNLWQEQHLNFTKMQKNKKIIITGGYGFIGSRFVKAVYDKTNYEILVIDSITYAADFNRIPDRIKEDIDRFRFLSKDICDVTCEDLKGATYLVNFAAESHVDNSITDGKPFIRSNIEGVFNLLQCGGGTVKKFIQISTDEVYGDMYDLRGRQYADESFRLRPSSYYSASKASADLLVQAAARTFGTPYIITRSCNNFGPGQHKEKFLPTIFDSIANDKDVPVYGDGLQSREWIHVDDNVEIILELVLSNVKDEIYNIGSGYHYKNIELVNYIGECLGTKVKRVPVEDRLGHDKVYRLNCKKVEGFLGERVYQCLEGYLKDEAKGLQGTSNRS